MRRWTSVVVVLLCLTGPVWAERMRSRDGTVRDVPAASVEYALKDGYERIPRVPMRHPDGSMVYLYEDEAKDAETRGLWRMGAEEESAEIARARSDEDARTQAEVERRYDELVTAERSRGLLGRLLGIVVDNMGTLLVVVSIAGITVLLKPWRYWTS